MACVVLLLVLLGFPLAVSAHDEVKPETPTLTVSATGTISQAPDTVFVTFGMETAGRSLVEAQRQNTTVMNNVVGRLRALQIDQERIQTSSFTVSPQYKPSPKRPAEAPPVSPEIIGYIVGNSVTAEVRSLDKIGTVIEESLSAGANRFQGLLWGLRDEQPGRLSALKTAAAKAREKAAALSDTLHVKLVRILTVNEGGHVVRPAPQFARSMMATENGGGEPPILPGEMKIEATVTLVYEIAPN